MTKNQAINDVRAAGSDGFDKLSERNQ